MEAATLQTTDADISNGNYSAPQPPIHQKEPIEKAIYDHYQDLKTRVVEQKEVKAREHVLQLRYKRVGVGLMTLAAALIAAAAMFSNSTLWILAALLPVLAIGLFAFSFDHRAEERRIGDELKRLEFERDLMKLQPDRGECRSEKMLGNNDSQLRGYYELNLEQCAKIFWVGILCLCAGVGVIAATLHSSDDVQGSSTNANCHWSSRRRGFNPDQLCRRDLPENAFRDTHHPEGIPEQIG
jgi:hypothetical protein